MGQARKNIEQIKPIDPEEFEKSFHQVQNEAEKNWKSVLEEIQDFGDRLTKAAQVAWEVLTAPKNDDRIVLRVNSRQLASISREHLSAISRHERNPPALRSSTCLRADCFR